MGLIRDFLDAHERHRAEDRLALNTILERLNTMSESLHQAVTDLTAEVAAVKDQHAADLAAFNALIAKIGALPDDSADVAALVQATADLKADADAFSASVNSAPATPPADPAPPTA